MEDEMAKNLRDFIKLLKEKAPEELMSGEKLVDSKFEATTLLRRLELEGKYPMVIFKNIKTVKGKPSDYPLVINTFASRKKLALAIDLEPYQWKMELPFGLMQRYSKIIPPQLIDKKDAPVKEVVKREGEVDLLDYPIPVHHARDGGPYILAASVVTKNPDTGVYNTAMIRLHVKGRNRTVIHAEPHHHSGMIVRSYLKKGKTCPFIAVIGHHPSFYLGSQWEGSFGKNEYEIIGGAMQEPLRLTPSETWGKDFLVPADAEIILEGEVLFNEVDEEGPIGEHTRYYKTIRGGKIEKFEEPVTTIHAITERKDAYFMSSFLAHPDQGLIGAIPKEAAIYEIARRSVPGLKAVHLTPGGVNRYICYLSLDQRVDGEAKDALLAAFIGDWHVKYAVAVDSDVDIFSDAEVLWAISTRTQPHQDTFIIPEAMGSPLDPTVGSKGTRTLTSRMGIDATKPVAEPFSEVCEVPRDLLERMNVEDYLTRFR
jgi:2,5-furandicarboxylate decarboxylase 1